ncbi:aldo/keto reductase [Candidatus Woesearchaeota archaeon]|nr:aldo/keto reductase [Candidatus Woesearchaeota archaeon]
MKKVKLGKTGLTVSRYCIGTDYKGDIFPRKGGLLLKKAFNLGINFWDTADMYGTHCHIKEALKYVPREKAIIATKIRSTTAKQAEKDLKRCLKEINTKYADIVYLHGIDSVPEFKKLKVVLNYLIKAKQQGLIKAIGLSTHSVELTKHLLKEPKIEVILAPVNFIGNKVKDGTQAQMNALLRKLHKAGRGVVAIKVMGGGKKTPFKDPKKAVKYVLGLPFIHSLCIGTRNLKQLKFNYNLFKQ